MFASWARDIVLCAELQARASRREPEMEQRSTITREKDRVICRHGPRSSCGQICHLRHPRKADACGAGSWACWPPPSSPPPAGR